MSREKFEKLLNSMSATKIKSIIKDYNDICVKEGRKGEKLRGYSGLSRDDLVEFLLGGLSDEETEQYFEKYKDQFMIDLTESTLSLIRGQDKRERITDIHKLPDEDGYSVSIKGLQWEEEATIVREDGKIYAECSCRIGRSDGLCRHQMALYLVMLSKNEIKTDELPFQVDKKWENLFVSSLDTVVTQTKSKKEADVMLAGEYRIFINKNQNTVTAQWEGDYAGKKTTDISQQKDDLDTWVATKVIEKVLKPIKVKTAEGEPRPIIIDRFGVIAKIMSRPKLIAKIQRKFKAIPDLPTEESDIYELLRKELTVDENPDFSDIVKIELPTKKKRSKK